MIEVALGAGAVELAHEVAVVYSDCEVVVDDTAVVEVMVDIAAAVQEAGTDGVELVALVVEQDVLVMTQV